MTTWRRTAVALAVCIALVGCGGGGSSSDEADDTTTTLPSAGAGLDPFATVEMLASNELRGRDNLSAGLQAARKLLLAILSDFADPVDPSTAGDAGYLQSYEAGTNIVGIVPGTGALADEYVMIGAHYDHLAPDTCVGRGEPDDEICNGAADNAAGVAAVLSIAEAVERVDGADNGRRSLIVGLWDGQEDGLVGSRFYAGNPFVALDSVVAYVNFDIQGAVLLPSLAETTVLIGAESGGEALGDAVLDATEASSLDYATLRFVFGQNRSDDVQFAAASVPTVFFTDWTGGCYHTVLDDIEHLDADKLELQIDTAISLVSDLTTTDTPPVFSADRPLTSYDDAVQLLDLMKRAEPDFERLRGAGPAEATAFLENLRTQVDEGRDAYDDAAGDEILDGDNLFLERLSNSECTVPS